MGFSTLIANINATCVAALGDAGTYTVARTGVEYADVPVILDDRTGEIDTGLGATVATRPTCRIDATDIPEPARHDTVVVNGVTYRVDAWSLDNGLYSIELRYEGGT